ncbi:hypothetical protein ACQZ3Y_09120 [Ralstonia pseudosolanacearum]|uniref:hypothetical protein n=1 Tax=Ralstonia pseudosolanacearum TaxID=1310165 RepID=UPI003D2EE8BF
MTITIALPYIRLGARELWIERVSPRQRGAWFSIQRDTSGTLLGLAWWDVQINRV